MHKTKSSKTDSPTYSNSSALNSHPQLAHRPFGSEIQKASVAAKTPTDIEDEGFAEQQMEATGLEIQAKYGSITPEGQERLTVLQAKMNGLLNSRLGHATRFSHNIANIPLHRPGIPKPIQAKLTIGEPGDKYEQEADRVAVQVVNQRKHPAAQQESQNLQREEISSEDELKMKPEVDIIQREELSKGEYDQIKELVENIEKQYPPEKYYYIGMGKSPTPIIAFMKAKGIPASNIPLSKFSPKPNNIRKEDRDKYKNNEKQLTQEQKEELKRHFDNFVPQAGKLQGKNILLIDYTQSGRSLIASHAHIVEYLNEKAQEKKLRVNYIDHGLDNPPKVVPLALYQKETHKAEEKLEELGLTNKIPLPGSLQDSQSLASQIGGEKYKKRAEFPDDYKIVKSPPDKSQDIKRSPEKYDELVEQFRSFMEEKKPLVELLSGEDAIEKGVQDIKEATGSSK
ncbi:MAG: hypothetical protein V7K53_01475 [Nostoc sp.]|uniref:hypothetical protein n=1 Tax=Nostoc sp. TaxID=1180 RepID=UPI002FF6C9A8